MSDKWPAQSCPLVTPSVCFYFARMIGDTPQLEVMAHTFMTAWQCGTFLKTVLGDDGEVLDVREYLRYGSEIEYHVVTERDAAGLPMKGKAFWGRIVGATYEDVISSARQRRIALVRTNVGENGARRHWGTEEGDERCAGYRDTFGTRKTP